MKNNNHRIRTPDQLFENHEDWAYVKLIDPKKEARMVEIFNEFSNTLYTRMTDEENPSLKSSLCSEFYRAEVRGFTLKAGSPPEVNLPWILDNYIQFNDLYIGSEKDIAPISSIFKGTEISEIEGWLDKDFRKFLYDLGWKCGILHMRGFGKDTYKIIIYQKRNKEW